LNNDFPLVPLGEVASPVQRPETPILGKTYRQIGVRLWGEGPYEREPVDGGQTKYKTLSRVESGDIIMNKIWARNGSVGVVSKSLAGSYGSNEFPTFTPFKGKLDSRWVHWLTKTKGFWAQCDEKSRGTSGKNRIRPERFLEIEIPLPLISEQRRIVARIEELAARIEEARGLRRQTVEEAVAFVKSARHQIFETLREQVEPVPLEQLAEAQLGKMLSRKAKLGIGSTPYLRNANIQWGRVDLSSVSDMDFSPTEKQKFALTSGDILVCEGGDIGKCAIWNNEIPGCCYQKALHRVRVDSSQLISRFLLHHLFWASEQGHWIDMKTQTTIAHLTGVKLKSYGVLVPTLDEQQATVSYLDDLQARVDSLKQLQTETAAELDALLPSVLDRAFKGGL